MKKDLNGTISPGLVVFVAAFAGSYPVYLICLLLFSDSYPADTTSLLYQSLLLLLVVGILEQENRSTHCVYPCYELGFIAWIFWPVFVPYYLIKSRGVRGLGLSVVLLTFICIDWIVYEVWLLFTPDAA